MIKDQSGKQWQAIIYQLTAGRSNVHPIDISFLPLMGLLTHTGKSIWARGSYVTNGPHRGKGEASCNPTWKHTGGNPKHTGGNPSYVIIQGQKPKVLSW